jgi:uncharacterized membrane-anchored protein YhcB (DUF1043 family)
MAGLEHVVNMTYELLLTFFVGFIVGALLNRSADSKEQQEIYEKSLEYYKRDIEYYKKLTRNLVEENSNLKQWQRRQLDVIESLEKQNASNK